MCTPADLSREARARMFSKCSLQTPQVSVNSFAFARWERASHHFSPPILFRSSPWESVLRWQAVVGMEVAGQAACCWEAAEGGCVLMEIGGGLF